MPYQPSKDRIALIDNRRRESTVWKTQDGRRVRLVDMSDRHIVNALNMLERQLSVERMVPGAAGTEHWANWIMVFKQELVIRGVDRADIQAAIDNDKALAKAARTVVQLGDQEYYSEFSDEINNPQDQVNYPAMTSGGTRNRGIELPPEKSSPKPHYVGKNTGRRFKFED